MITGVVNADREPIIRIRVRGVNGQEQECDAVVDMGFTGWLTLPLHFIATLGLTWREFGAAILADGSRVFFDVFDATVIWDGQPMTIAVDEANADPLAGMALMEGFRILVEDVDGGLVQLERI